MKYSLYSNNRKYFAFALLFFLILICYSNTFNSSWHLDDFPNIVENKKLTIKDLSLSSIKQTFYAKPGQRPVLKPSQNNNLYRPVPCFTFALNRYFGNGKIQGYHYVNILIHFTCAFFLFLTILELFNSPVLKDKYSSDDTKYFIALLSAVLWAVNPVQTQAVTYIVQRMASMAAMFYIISIYFYVKARSCFNSRRFLYYFFCLISFGLAMGSKENSATLPIALFFLEIIFFQKFSTRPEKIRPDKKILFLLPVIIIFSIISGMILFKLDPFFFLKGYAKRSFTLSERLMTEPGIIFYYISQIFYPAPTRLSIEHDISVSTSLFNPWTTLPAILIIICTLIFGLLQIRKRPILSFSIIFFFLNHIIESTILPLELVFEHRSYLPSLFIFFPVAAGLKWTLDYYKKKESVMRGVFILFIILLITGLGAGTYIRNMAWANEGTLWEDAVLKAPDRARANYNLAKYYRSVGRFDEAMELYKKSFASKASSPNYSKALALNGAAGIYFIKKNYEKVLSLCNESLKILPKFKSAQYNIIISLIILDRLDEALKQINSLPAVQKESPVFLNLKGLIFIKQKNPKKALLFLSKAIKTDPKNRDPLLYTGAALNLLGNYKQAEWFFKSVYSKFPYDTGVILCLIENRLKAGDFKKAGAYADSLLEFFTVNKIQTRLAGFNKNSFSVPVSEKLISSYISRHLLKNRKL